MTTLKERMIESITDSQRYCEGKTSDFKQRVEQSLRYALEWSESTVEAIGYNQANEMALAIIENNDEDKLEEAFVREALRAVSHGGRRNYAVDEMLRQAYNKRLAEIALEVMNKIRNAKRKTEEQK